MSNANRLRRIHTKPKIQKITSFLNYFHNVYTGENGLRLFSIRLDVQRSRCPGGVEWSLKQQERRVEIKGFEPLAYALQRHRSTN